jgi:hypothetical protein
VKRLRTWRTALHAEVERHRREPFAWGSDCAIFVADCLLAMTGEDAAAGFRGRYKTAAGALKALKKAGHNDLLSLVSAHLEEIPILMAGEGDIAAFENAGTGWTLGVFGGARIIAKDVGGLSTIDRLSASKAFRVP